MSSPLLRRAARRAFSLVAADVGLFPTRGDSARRQLDETVRALRESDERRILVGPWLSEVGFEVLYWIPFLRWLSRSYGLAPERFAAVSRGGVGSWYAGICDHYVDVFELASAGEFNLQTSERVLEVGGQKQLSVRRWDELLLRRASTRLGWEDAQILHPSLMYQLFRAAWLGKGRRDVVTAQTVHERFPTPTEPELEARLPKSDYIAVKFYFRPSFPDTPSNRERVAATIQALAESWPVVLLNTGLELDDHPDFEPTGSNAIRLMEGVAPAMNLRAQSVAISRARAFVGTYGGLTYVASAYGVPSVSFYSDSRALVPEHLEVGRLVGEALGAPVSALDLAQRGTLGFLRPLFAQQTELTRP